MFSFFRQTKQTKKKPSSILLNIDMNIPQNIIAINIEIVVVADDDHHYHDRRYGGGSTVT